MRKVRNLLAVILCATLAACGGGNSDDTTSVALPGWFNCGGAGIVSDNLGHPTSVLFTRSGKFFGSCGGYSSFTGNYTAQLHKSTPNLVTATLNYFWFYDTVTNQRAVNDADTPIPADSYAGTGSYSATLVDINFTETGTASRAGSINRFVIPTKLILAQMGGLGVPVVPASLAGFGGHYGQILSIPVALAGNTTSYTFLANVDITIDPLGNLSGTLPNGKLSATTSSYDSSTGIAEFTGNITTSSGVAPVSGAYAYSPRTNLLGGAPIAIYVVGSTFEYAYELSPRN